MGKSLGLIWSLSISAGRRANESEVMNIIGDVSGKDVILVDDMIDTAGTMCKAAEALKDKGATSVMALGTHAILSGPAISRIQESVLDEMIVSNSIPLHKACEKITVLNVAPLFAEVAQNLPQ